MLKVKWVDVVLVLAVFAAQSAPFFGEPTARGEYAWLAHIPVAGTALALLLRRSRPVMALFLTSVCIALYGEVGDGPAQPIWYAALICMFSLGLYAKRSQQIFAVAVSAIGLLSVVGSVATAVREVLMWSTAFALGLTFKARQELAAKAAELAAERERTRIGRDLHDILGHAVSLMIVQAEAGAAVAKKDPVKAEAALDAIAEAGRSAMGQLRSSVSGLRGSLEPQPGLAELPALIKNAGHASLSVTLREQGHPITLPPNIQLAVYRVTQEALTNVVKHSGATSAEVLLDWADGKLRLVICDNGHGAPKSKSGHGLTGMRERVAAVGGRLSTRSQDNGFEVEAVFT
ncbi:sensor histidine kinase [Catelliglobosispora koreensis]|uniref:sensor histidine kinase n=1 Tax=Catelliglobosispora koreensis TaxID=129052 RepID=UPI00037BCA09|nr:sensor histidine kinase [Catelliglobosispora koreensis]